ncbi:phosphate ABC transporter permease subunit PstC [Porphyromonas levii]|uniref:phosphate ABC transporter permease subunit PstC n=1 Tax=Porphyromonas levii TaxID=28114 RepID=UPI00039CE32D|nr:phosphate ABC transporter permease subunit PstC [Porphyromonas levii]MBR8703424.1 Phosphate transport system permease protein PstC [Porphyromonas levii]MBR8712604.1 Phosphate transport system permease protein PstC [Porphyromonas levii]MBR8714596.1 Phosphate transport system permease protein PstC [Porphyromonas levii]MBR8727123.1 Phosphate transport system permease protein PstC [Porphyromonas levii]MBR8735536.1 Phosphate transport system permease protein PstC [Porphyromonas levii]
MKDKLFNLLLTFSGVLIIMVAGGILYALMSQSLPAIQEYGLWHFITSAQWSDRENVFGALPFIIGTLMTSVLALLFCIPFSLSVALFTGEYFRGKKVALVVGTVVDLLAGIPSIVYGLWGFYTVRPLMISMGVNDQGMGVLLASIVLAIMIIPYASSLSSEFISMVPNDLKEGAYSLGATRLEVIKSVSMPAAGSGIFAAYILAFGRALGETMAVTMLIGNTKNIPLSLRDTGDTMASVIANQFGEASGLKLSSLFAIGFLLFLITALINLFAKSVIKRVNNQ